MRISEAESVVMEDLWQADEAQSAEDIFARVGSVQSWQEATVKTLLNRLLKKRAIAATRDGRRYLYRPLLSRESWLGQQSRSFIDRLYGGQVSALVAHFSRAKALSRQEIDEIRQLIETIDDER